MLNTVGYYKAILSNATLPDFNHEGVIPPFVFATDIENRSPYKISFIDLISIFATSVRRCTLLKGLLRLRKKLFLNNISGFQWINGSFCQKLTGREPHDIDVVNFCTYNDSVDNVVDLIIKEHLIRNCNSKYYYFCDSYFVDCSINCTREFGDLSNLINQTCYWFSLFSHTRNNVWKGILQLDMQSSKDEFDFYISLLDWRLKNGFDN